jgi:hypothetical protein
MKTDFDHDWVQKLLERDPDLRERLNAEQRAELAHDVQVQSAIQRLIIAVVLLFMLASFGYLVGSLMLGGDEVRKERPSDCQTSSATPRDRHRCADRSVR